MKPEIILYLRLSLEDGDLQDGETSNSIENQKNLLMDFIETQTDLKNGTLHILQDDGYSGTNLNRPSFQKIIEMAENRLFSVLIVKDFSRFARDHMVVCDYIQQIFPLLGIRFISVNDCYDGARDYDKSTAIEVGFRNIVYSYYSQDLSTKIKSAKKTSAKMGKQSSGMPPFGYKRDKTGQFMPENTEAKVVQLIFHLASEGMSIVHIAKKLNHENTPSKSMLKLKTTAESRTGAVRKNNIWKYGEIYKILQDEQYLGRLVFGKTEKRSISERKQTSLPKKHWIVVDHCHEALVSQEVFNQANANIPRRSSSKKKRHTRLFQGKLKCGLCQLALSRCSEKHPKYHCKTGTYVEDSPCDQVFIMEHALKKLIFQLLSQIVNSYVDFSSMPKQDKNSLSSTKKKMALYERNLQKLQHKSLNLYEMWLEEKISKDTYLAQKMDLEERISVLIQAISLKKQEIEKKKQQNTSPSPTQNYFQDLLKSDTLCQAMVVNLIDCIYLYPGQKLEICFNFTNPCPKITTSSS